MTSCELHKDHPENTVMPDALALEHFQQCLGPEARLQCWSILRHYDQVGLRCESANHRATIDSQAQYTAKLLAGIRELLEGAPTRGEIRDKLRGLIS
jgi:hypothetical protein